MNPTPENSLTYYLYIGSTKSKHEEDSGLIHEIRIIIKAKDKTEATSLYYDCVSRNNLLPVDNLDFEIICDAKEIDDFEELVLSSNELKELNEKCCVSAVHITLKEFDLETLMLFSKNQLINRVRGLKTAQGLENFDKELVTEAIEHYDDIQYRKYREYLEDLL